MSLKQMEEAPKKSVILLDVGLPWLVAGIWNKPSQNWVYADLQVDLYEGEWHDTYFENEHEKKPKGWMPMPDKNEEMYEVLVRYEQALKDICRHQKIIAGGVYEQTGAWQIANKALNFK